MKRDRYNEYKDDKLNHSRVRMSKSCTEPYCKENQGVTWIGKERFYEALKNNKGPVGPLQVSTVETGTQFIYRHPHLAV